MPRPFPPESAANTIPDPAWAEQRAERLPGQPEPWAVRGGQAGGREKYGIKFTAIARTVRGP